MQGGAGFGVARRFDARDHVVAEANLFIKPARAGQHLAGDEIGQQHHDGGGADIDGRRHVPDARFRREKRLMGARDGDGKGLGHLRFVLDAGAGWNLDGRAPIPTRLTGADSGWSRDKARVCAQRAFAQKDLAAVAEAAPAAAGIQGQTVIRADCGQCSGFVNNGD